MIPHSRIYTTLIAQDQSLRGSDEARSGYVLFALAVPELIRPQINCHASAIKFLKALESRRFFTLVKSGDITSGQRYGTRLSTHALDTRQRTKGQPTNVALHDHLEEHPNLFGQLVMVPDLRFNGESELREWYEDQYGEIFTNYRASNTAPRTRFPKVDFDGDYIRWD